VKKWDSLVERLSDLDRARGIRESTIKHKEKELYKWGIWLKQRKPKPKLEEINLEIIHDYIKSRTTFISKSSTCGVIGNMRALGDLFVEEGYWQQNPLRWISGPKLSNTRKIPKTYKRSDLKKIFDESFNVQYPYFRALYPAIISVFYSTGIRKGELLSLNLKDWDRDKSTLKIIGAKSNKERIVIVPEVGWRCIENYLKSRANLLQELGIYNDGLFLNRRGSRVNGTQILVQFKRIAKRVNVDKCTIHMFRHSCATGLIEEGVPLFQVQQTLGHASTATTMRYLSISDPERKKAMRKHPINNILQKLKEQEDEL
jgi:integrase/recombinase XerC